MPAAIIPAAISLIQMGVGAAQKAKAKKEAKKLEESRPKTQITPETTGQLKLAESELQQGMGARAERAYTQQSDKAMSGSLAAILKGGGNVNSVGDLYGQNEEGRLKLAMLEEGSRVSKIQNLIDAQKTMTGERQKQFEFNEWMPWADKAQANAAAKEAANAQISSGIQGLGSAAMQYGQQKFEDKMFDKYSQVKPPATTTNTTGYIPQSFGGSAGLRSQPNTPSIQGVGAMPEGWNIPQSFNNLTNRPQ